MPRTPIHPGEILADELESISMTAKQLANLLEVPPNRILEYNSMSRLMLSPGSPMCLLWCNQACSMSNPSKMAILRTIVILREFATSRLVQNGERTRGGRHRFSAAIWESIIAIAASTSGQAVAWSQTLR